MDIINQIKLLHRNLFAEMTRTIVDVDKREGATNSRSSLSSLSFVFNFSASTTSFAPSHFLDGAARCAGDGTQFWDPLRQTCYNVTCGFLYTNVGGQCVYRNISQSLLKEANQECFKITINPWELRRVG